MSEYKEGPKVNEDLKKCFRAPKDTPRKSRKAPRRSTSGKKIIKIKGDIESPIEPPEAWESLR